MSFSSMGNFQISGAAVIGTTSPTESLQTTSNLLSGSASGNYLKMAPGTNDTTLYMRNATAGEIQWQIDSTGNSTGTSLGGGRLAIFNGAGTNYNQFLLAGNTGNVVLAGSGIGNAGMGLRCLLQPFRLAEISPVEQPRYSTSLNYRKIKSAQTITA